MKLLLLSNSTNPGEVYLTYPLASIHTFLGAKPLNIIFVPYAAVTFSYDVYEQKVNESLHRIGHRVTSIHRYDDPLQAVNEADVIMIGGGNTWKLTQQLHAKGLMSPIATRIKEGIPYIGWSAGSNVACPSLRTTNDMPIVDPQGFDTLNLVPFQINPHYMDDHPSNHGGETREMRINEFVAENPSIAVVGLRESTILHYEHAHLRLIGDRSARIFRHGIAACELTNADNFDFLLQ